MLDGYQDFRQTREYADFMHKSGWVVKKTTQLSTNASQMFLYLWEIPIIKGKYLSLHRIPPSIDVRKLVNFATQQNTFLLRIDFNTQKLPTRTLSLLNQQGFIFVNWCSAPTKTKILELRFHSVEKIFNQFKPKMRYNIRLAQKHGCTVEFFTFDQLKNKQNVLQQFSELLFERKRETEIEAMSSSQLLELLESFQKKAYLATVNKDGVLLAAGIFLTSKTVMFYTQNASTSEGKKLFAPSLLLWEATKLAKRLKLRYFDFEGVIDERNLTLTSSWQGFTKFKQGFGGIDIEQELPFQKLFLQTSFLGKITDFFRKKYLKYRILPSIYPSQVDL